jgi:hypothetical protein
VAEIGTGARAGISAAVTGTGIAEIAPVAIDPAVTGRPWIVRARTDRAWIVLRWIDRSEAASVSAAPVAINKGDTHRIRSEFGGCPH